MAKINLCTPPKCSCSWKSKCHLW